jgi:hypothetical protein
MLAKGLSDSLPTYGPHLLFYDLDGDYLRGTDYGDVLEYLFPADMCIASDGGYTFTTKYFPPVWHTDQYGETLWWQSIYVTPNDWHKGYCIRRTMDSGYIFSGWTGYCTTPTFGVEPEPPAWHAGRQYTRTSAKPPKALCIRRMDIPVRKHKKTYRNPLVYARELNDELVGDNLTRKQLAERHGISSDRVTQWLCLLKLPEKTQKQIEALGDNWEKQLVTERELRRIRKKNY